MPIPYPPYTQKCPKCGWSKTYVPDSDVLFDHRRCPSCGNEELSRTKLNPILGDLYRKINQIGGIFRRRGG